MATSEDTPTSGMIQGIKALVERIKASLGPQLQNIREHLPDESQVQVMLSWLVVSLALGMVGGVTLTGCAVCLAVALPIIVFLWSPILMAVGGTLFVVSAVVLIGFRIGFVAFSMAVWLYKYLFNGEEPVYLGHVDAARSRTAGVVHEWAQNHIPGYSAAQSA